MKCKLFTIFVIAPFLALVPTAVARTWYVNGASGSNSSTYTSPTTACKTTKHAISLAASGDSIMVAPVGGTGCETGKEDFFEALKWPPFEAVAAHFQFYVYFWRKLSR